LVPVDKAFGTGGVDSTGNELAPGFTVPVGITGPGPVVGGVKGAAPVPEIDAAGIGGIPVGPVV